jgi:hypothetical protein
VNPDFLVDLRLPIGDFGPVIADILEGQKGGVTKNATRVSERLWLIRANWQLAIEKLEI